MTPEKLPAIRLNMTEREIQDHLQTYCAKARELGASEAQAIPASMVPVDDRVTLKCSIPKCFGFGTCANCPPHSMKPDETRRILGLYRWGVTVRLSVPAPVIIRDKATIKERVDAYVTLSKIVNALESAAFYDGHYLAVGFGAGSCKSTFCHDKDCEVIGGRKCRLALRSRPSMEAVGIDCFRLATEIGWDIIPIGSDAPASCLAHGSLMGLILID